jgi:hypothetical protein
MTRQRYVPKRIVQTTLHEKHLRKSLSANSEAQTATRERQSANEKAQTAKRKVQRTKEMKGHEQHLPAV